MDDQSGSGTPTPASFDEPGGRAPAPEGLRLVQQFLNSNDIEGGTDEFATAAQLASWLSACGLLAAGRRLTGEDRDMVVAVREALREVAGANAGAAVSKAAVETLNRLDRAVVRVEFDAQGGANLRAASPGVHGALATLLGQVFQAVADGSWSRLKVCRRDACRWVFYDHSRNRSGTWCTMAICGSRTKAQSYYRRHAAGGTLTS
jgi:predicted RNA-binding Zn ribbon-like protein